MENEDVDAASLLEQHQTRGSHMWILVCCCCAGPNGWAVARPFGSILLLLEKLNEIIAQQQNSCCSNSIPILLTATDDAVTDK